MPRQQLPDDVAAQIEAFAATVLPVADVVGLYAAGSLATGGYRPATSDLDLVAVLHRSLAREHPRAGTLHCAYLPARRLGEPGRLHWTWAHGTLYRRPLTQFARAELHPTAGHPGGVVLHGPPQAFFGPAGDARGIRAVGPGSAGPRNAPATQATCG